jgi:hypothetical protein
MPTVLMILLQAASVAPMTFEGDDFDLAREVRPETPEIGQRCTNNDPSVIVVCGSRNQKQYRLPGVESEPTLVLPKAEFSLGEGFTAKVQLDSAPIGGGLISRRAMITVTKKF